jgi:hypothetical protein
MSPAMNESPAPTVSATVMGSAAISTRPARERITGPEAPRVRAATAGPSASQASSASSGERSG